MVFNEKQKRVRVINCIGINLAILLVLPNYLNSCGYKNDYWTLAIFGAYLFLFFSFWVFIYFISQEIKYTLEKKVNFFKHILKNKLVFWGIVPFLLYLILRFSEFVFCK